VARVTLAGHHDLHRRIHLTPVKAKIDVPA
jgi:hypothetical protein